jgi:hypothetical protein
MEMEKGKFNPEKLEGREFIDGGSDSEIFLVKGRVDQHKVVKKYFKKEGVTFSLLREYIDITDKVIILLAHEPNPLKQSVIIDSEYVPLKYEAVKQGSISPNQNENGEVIEVYGQEFIPGSNLVELIREGETREDQKVLKQGNILDDINTYSRKLFMYLSNILNKNLVYSPTNVKPFYKVKEKEVVVIITDLAGELTKMNQ